MSIEAIALGRTISDGILAALVEARHGGSQMSVGDFATIALAAAGRVALLLLKPEQAQLRIGTTLVVACNDDVRAARRALELALDAKAVLDAEARTIGAAMLAGKKLA